MAKELNFTYADVQELRETLVQELKTQFTTLSVDHMKLIEMRMQTLIMAGIDKTSVESRKKFFK